MQLIWGGSDAPVNEIKALVNCSEGKARQYWNARPKTDAEWSAVNQQIKEIRAKNDKKGKKQPYNIRRAQ
jgi:hypothetical protein